MSDIGTMIWKEAKDLIFQGRWGPWLRPLLLLGVVGVALPWRAGQPWLALSPAELLLILWVPFITIISFIGDAIAGERERHTLETLLASRMPDHAILLGKVIVTVGYAWSLALASLLLGSLTVNVLRGNEPPEGWVFYHPLELFVEALVLCLLVSLLAASGGVLISLRSATVRQAQQSLIIAMIVLSCGAVFAISVLPAGLLAALSYVQLLRLTIAVLALLDSVLLGGALMSFQRSRLIVR